MENIFQKNTLNMIWISLLFFVLCISVIFLQFFFVPHPNYEILNIAIFSSIFIYHIVYFFILVKIEENLRFILFTPLFWYKLVSLLFFGLGPLVYYFGSDLTIEIINLYYFMTDEILFRIAVIYLFVIILIDILFLFQDTLLPFKKEKEAKNINKELLLFISLSIGIISKYFLVLPSFMEIIPPPPGIFYTMTNLTYISLFLLYNLGEEKNLRYKTLFYLLLSVEIFSSFLLLSKESLIMPAMFATFTIYFHKKDLKKLITVGFVSFILYALVIQNIFLVLRSAPEINSETGFQIKSVEQLTGAFSISSIEIDGYSLGSYQAWWERLSLAVYQGYAIEAYDNDLNGTTFETIKFIIVPRFLYPEKPNLSYGQLYHNLATNTYNERVTNSTGPGIFIEAFWNGGWTYLIIVIFYFSILLFYFSRLIIKNMKEKNYFILIICMNAIYLGRSIDDWFVARYGSFILTMLITYIFIITIYYISEIILKTVVVANE